MHAHTPQAVMSSSTCRGKSADSGTEEHSRRGGGGSGRGSSILKGIDFCQHYKPGSQDSSRGGEGYRRGGQEVPGEEAAREVGRGSQEAVQRVYVMLTHISADRGAVVGEVMENAVRCVHRSHCLEVLRLKQSKYLAGSGNPATNEQGVQVALWIISRRGSGALQATDVGEACVAFGYGG